MEYENTLYICIYVLCVSVCIYTLRITIIKNIFLFYYILRLIHYERNDFNVDIRQARVRVRVRVRVKSDKIWPFVLSVKSYNIKYINNLIKIVLLAREYFNTYKYTL